MFRNIVIFLLFNVVLVNSFQVKNFQKSSYKPIFFFPNILSKQVPSELYSNFLANLQNNEYNVLISQDQQKNQNYIEHHDIEDGIILAHSFAAKEAIDFFRKNDKIKKMVLIDPLDTDKVSTYKFSFPKIPSIIPDLEEKIKDNTLLIQKLESKIDEIYNTKSNETSIINSNKEVLVIKSKESSKWSIFPSIPPKTIIGIKTIIIITCPKKAERIILEEAL